jgi:hypothetical protein
MPTSDSSRDSLLERLAEDFVERHRRGERPALSEYIDRHPELAAEIRELFPALVQFERIKLVAGELTGAFVHEAGPSTSPIPERLGEYRILRQVRGGGMGIVYEAEQESLGRQLQPGQQVLALVGLAVAVSVPQGAEIGRVHHVQGAVMVGEPLDRVEVAGENGGLVGVAVAVGVLDQADLVVARDRRAQSGEVIGRDEQRSGALPGGDSRGVFDQGGRRRTAWR